MTKPSQAAYLLQQLDLELERVGAEAQAINAALKDDAALRQATEEHEAAQHSLRQRQRQLHEAEQGLAGLAAKIKGHQDRLYSGAIGNPRELGTLQQEVQHLRGLHNAQEDRVLEAMDAVEHAQAEVSQKTGARAAREQTRQQEQATLLERQQQVEAKLAALRQNRQSQANDCGPALLARYEQIRKQRGKAVALAEGSTCQGCRVTLTSSVAQRLRHGADIVTCDNCGRILHLP